jgi:hypothetical protein
MVPAQPQPPPARFATYIATSALRTMSSALTWQCSLVTMLMPMLAEDCTSLPKMT